MKKMLRLNAVASGMLLALVVAPSVRAQILSENFNSVSIGGSFLQYTAPATVGAFTLSSGGVDSVDNGFLAPVAGQTTGNYLDLDGTLSGGGVLDANMLLVQQGTVTLSFALAGSQRGDTNTVRVSLGSLYTEDFTLTSDTAFATYTRQIDVTSTQNVLLRFDHSVTFADNSGLLLDDVILTQSSIVTTEPGTGALMAFVAVMGCGVAVQRRGKARTAC